MTRQEDAELQRRCRTIFGERFVRAWMADREYDFYKVILKPCKGCTPRLGEGKDRDSVGVDGDHLVIEMQDGIRFCFRTSEWGEVFLVTDDNIVS